MNKLKSDFENETIKAFEEDLNLKAQMGVRGFPSIFFLDKDGNRFLVYGSKPYEKYEEVLLKLFPEAKKKVYETDPVSLFQKHPTFTTKEFVVLSGKEMKEAENFLEELAAQGKIQKQVSKNGPLWIKADF